MRPSSASNHVSSKLFPAEKFPLESSMPNDVPSIIVKDSTSVTSEGSCLSSEPSSDGESNSTANRTTALLRRANRRIHQQRLGDEAKYLRRQVEALKREAVEAHCLLMQTEASKLELLNRNNDLERKLGQTAKKNKKLATLVEKGAHVEREFMNQLNNLSIIMTNTERSYMNQVIERDGRIAQLEEQIRRYESGESRMENLLLSPKEVGQQEQLISLRQEDVMELQMKAARVPELEAQVKAFQSASCLLKDMEAPFDKGDGDMRRDLADASIEEEEFISQLESLELDISKDLVELESTLSDN